MRQQGLLFLVAAANYLVNGLFHDMTIIPMVHMILFFMAGVTVNIQTQAAEWEHRAFGALAAGEAHMNDCRRLEHRADRGSARPVSDAGAAMAADRRIAMADRLPKSGRGGPQ